MKERGDLVMRLSGVDEGNGLPSANDLLLNPLVRLSEVVVNGLVNHLTKAVESRLWVWLQQVVKREVQGVSD